MKQVTAFHFTRECLNVDLVTITLRFHCQTKSLFEFIFEKNHLAIENSRTGTQNACLNQIARNTRALYRCSEYSHTKPLNATYECVYYVYFLLFPFIRAVSALSPHAM